MKKGFIIAFPTDTVYGIGTRYNDNIGVSKINRIKKRSDSKPMAILCSDIKMIEKLGVVDDTARKIITAFMPGAFTIILKSTDKYLKETNEDTVGVRIPDNSIAINLIKKYGPLKTTSINEHGRVPLNDIKEIKKLYNNEIDLIIEPDNSVLSEIASTVLDYHNGELILLREGKIKISDIKNVLR